MDRDHSGDRTVEAFAVFTDIEKANTFLAPYIDSSRPA